MGYDNKGREKADETALPPQQTEEQGADAEEGGWASQVLVFLLSALITAAAVIIWNMVDLDGGSLFTGEAAAFGPVLAGIIAIAVIGIYGTVKRSWIGVYASLGLAMVFLVGGGWVVGNGGSILGAVLAVLGVALVVTGVATRRNQPQ